MKTILALFLVLTLAVTPFAVAGSLGSADSNFMFGDAQEATAVPMSDAEMEGTVAQLINIAIAIPVNLGVSLCGIGIGILGSGAGTCGQGDNDGIDFKIIDS